MPDVPSNAREPVSITHTDCAEHRTISRRGLIGGSFASLAMWGMMPKAGIAGTRDPRLLVMILRGGVDGLALAAPMGDPSFAALRGVLALPTSGPGAGTPLDGLFTLNAAMPALAKLYRERQALLLHAVATPYRGRSHFDGQDVLESGHGGVVRVDDGWLNRALRSLPSAGAVKSGRGLAIGAIVPLSMRGAAPVLSWAPRAYNTPMRESTIARLDDLYAATDKQLAAALAEGREVERIGNSGMAKAPLGTRGAKDFIETADRAARFLAEPTGPRIGVLSYNGWDTHANEGAVKGTLANRLTSLDAAIETFAKRLGSAAWKDTVVMIVTEFGRTVRINGTNGTDHGTGTVAMLVGGAVSGGRVLADWPGLAEKNLYENRDLMPTRDLRSVLKGVLRDHLGIPAGALARTIFPGSDEVEPMDDLLRSA